MSSTRTVVIIGCRGALGAAISRRFRNENWRRILVGFSPNPEQDDSNSIFVNVAGVNSPKVQSDMISSSLGALFKTVPVSVDAVVNVSGGFCMDSANVRLYFLV